MWESEIHIVYTVKTQQCRNDQPSVNIPTVQESGQSKATKQQNLFNERKCRPKQWSPEN